MIEAFLSNQGAVPNFINYRLHLSTQLFEATEYLPAKVQILLGKSGAMESKVLRLPRTARKLIHDCISTVLGPVHRLIKKVEVASRDQAEDKACGRSSICHI